MDKKAASVSTRRQIVARSTKASARPRYHLKGP